MLMLLLMMLLLLLLLGCRQRRIEGLRLCVLWCAMKVLWRNVLRVLLHLLRLLLLRRAHFIWQRLGAAQPIVAGRRYSSVLWRRCRSVAAKGCAGQL